MKVRIKPSVHTDDCCWGAFIREGSNKNEIDIVDPIKCWIWVTIKPFASKGINDTVRHGKIRVELVIDIFARMNAANG